MIGVAQPQSAVTRLPHTPLPTIPASRTPTVPNSPTRARSTGDLLSEHERSKNRERTGDNDTGGPQNITTLRNSSSVSLNRPASEDVPNGVEAVDVTTDVKKEVKEKDG